MTDLTDTNDTNDVSPLLEPDTDLTVEAIAAG